MWGERAAAVAAAERRRGRQAAEVRSGRAAKGARELPEELRAALSERELDAAGGVLTHGRRLGGAPVGRERRAGPVAAGGRCRPAGLTPGGRWSLWGRWGGNVAVSAACGAGACGAGWRRRAAACGGRFFPCFPSHERGFARERLWG